MIQSREVPTRPMSEVEQAGGSQSRFVHERGTKVQVDSLPMRAWISLYTLSYHVAIKLLNPKVPKVPKVLPGQSYQGPVMVRGSG